MKHTAEVSPEKSGCDNLSEQNFYFLVHIHSLMYCHNRVENTEKSKVVGQRNKFPKVSDTHSEFS